jgi:lipoic acid synthetase
METLIPDFMTKWDLLYQVIDEKPEVVSHNMETVKRLYRKVRPQAKYERSLEQIQKTKLRGRRTKSGMMLGLGETEAEVLEAMQHLVNHGCDVLTLGQYLQPTKMHLSIERFVTPDEFDFYKQEGLQMGFKYVESGPLVRSSYHAERHVI